MGMSSGVGEADVVHNRDLGRMQYGGEGMAMAKAVQDAAQGAMVLLSESTFRHCHPEQLRQVGIMVGHMGEHVLKEGKPAVHVYAAMTRATLIHRFASLGPVR